MKTNTDLRLILVLALFTPGCLMAATPDDPNVEELEEERTEGVIANPAACAKAPRRTVSVNNATALNTALSNARPGDHIVLQNGTYSRSGGFALAASGTATDPIVVRAASPHAATLTSALEVTGSRACVVRLSFNGPSAYLKVGGTSNKVLGNRFRDWRGVGVRVVDGEKVEIAYNELSNPHPWQSQELSGYPLRIGIRTIHTGVANFHFDGYVHHNYFHDFPAKPDPDDYHSGQSDAIEICETATTGLNDGTYDSGWVIERNLIERHNQGHGVVDIKCGGTVVRFNTLINSPGGRIDLRNGPFSTLAGNWIENSGGMVILSKGHKIFGNRLINTGGGILLPDSEVEWNAMGKQRVRNAHLAGNVSNKLVLGKSYALNENLEPVDTLIEAHTGPIQRLDDKGTVQRAQASVSVPTAIKLAPSQVGPGALPIQ